MKRHTLRMVILLVSVAVVAACGNGGGGAAAPAPAGGNVEAGEALFAQSTIGSLPGCITCHSLEAGKTLVGLSPESELRPAGLR
jgi:mono/diheme cytochrome c family protein